MVCRDAVVQDGIAIARVWVAAWQAAYAGLDGGEKHDDRLTGFALHEVRYCVALPAIEK